MAACDSDIQFRWYQCGLATGDHQPSMLNLQDEVESVWNIYLWEATDDPASLLDGVSNML